MKLHDLQPDAGSKTKKTRVGRGIAAGKGKTAGRGTKGAGARGRSARKGAYFEGGQLPLVRRLPFKRGFNNIFKIYYQEVNVEQLETLDAGTTVTPELMAEHGWIRDAEKPVVVLGAGELSKQLTVQAHRFSKSAQEKIGKAGGSTEPLALKLTGSRATVKLLSKEEQARIAANKS